MQNSCRIECNRTYTQGSVDNNTDGCATRAAVRPPRRLQQRIDCSDRSIRNTENLAARSRQATRPHEERVAPAAATEHSPQLGVGTAKSIGRGGACAVRVTRPRENPARRQYSVGRYQCRARACGDRYTDNSTTNLREPRAAEACVQRRHLLASCSW